MCMSEINGPPSTAHLADLRDEAERHGAGALRDWPSAAGAAREGRVVERDAAADTVLAAQRTKIGPFTIVTIETVSSSGALSASSAVRWRRSASSSRYARSMAEGPPSCATSASSPPMAGLLGGHGVRWWPTTGSARSRARSQRSRHRLREKPSRVAPAERGSAGCRHRGCRRPSRSDRPGARSAQTRPAWGSARASGGRSLGRSRRATPMRLSAIP